MARKKKLTARTAVVFGALANSRDGWRYALDLCQETGVKAGRIYPILMRLLDRRLLETAWEKDIPAGSAPRHLYRLSGAGRAWASEVVPKERGAAKSTAETPPSTPSSDEGDP